MGFVLGNDDPARRKTDRSKIQGCWAVGKLAEHETHRIELDKMAVCDAVLASLKSLGPSDSTVAEQVCADLLVTLR